MDSLVLSSGCAYFSYQGDGVSTDSLNSNIIQYADFLTNLAR